MYFLEPGAQFIQGFPRTLLTPGEGCVSALGDCRLMVDWRLIFSGLPQVLLLQRKRQQGSEKNREPSRHLLDRRSALCAMLSDTPVDRD